jgi:hypothetical protein
MHVNPAKLSCGSGANGPSTPGRLASTPWSAISGFSYATNLIDHYTTVSGSRVTFYFTLSSFNPYEVSLMKASFSLN